MPWRYYLLALLPSLPLLALSLSFRRIVDQKTVEVIGRLTALDPELWGRSYGVGGAAGNAATQRKRLEDELNGFYNWRTYYVPLLLTCLVSFGVALVTFQKIGLPIGLDDVVTRASTPAVIGAGGAYLWGLNDLIQRHRSADISSSSLHTAWLRILLGGVVGALLGAFYQESNIINAVSFALGGLPIEDLKRWISQKADINWKKPDEYPADIHLIQGMNKRMMDRLYDEEIDSVQSLAFADPVRLLFRTNIEWNVILDLIDQAMLVSVVGDRVQKLRSMNIRCAIELASLYQQMFEGDNSEQVRATKVFQDIAKTLGVSDEMAVNMGYQLYYDPLLEFIWGHWSEARRNPHDDDDDEDGDNAAPMDGPNAPKRNAPLLLEHANAVENRPDNPPA